MVKAEGTFLIPVESFSPDAPISRMRIDYGCESCDYSRQLMRGHTLSRSVTIELSPMGHLLSVEYLHPGGKGERPPPGLSPFPETALCPQCDGVLRRSVIAIIC